MRQFFSSELSGFRRDETREREQCDQIGQFIGLWATFQSLWQPFILPKFPTFLGIFCKGVKIFGQLLKTFGDYLLVTLRATQQRTKTRTKDRSDRSERKKEKRTQNVSAESKILKINGHLDRQTDKWRTDVSSG